MDLSMRNANFFANPLGAVQLLSVFNHINTLNDFLLKENILSKENQFKPVPIVNALYEYLDKAHYSFHIRTELVHRLLAGSDLYGATANETIDFDYVIVMIDYIISDIVFTKYGNLHGFLAETMLSTKNLTPSSFREKMKSNLENSLYENEDGTISKLSRLSVKRITQDIIFPLFPRLPSRSKNNITVVSPDYMYAQAGLAFARSAGIYPDKFTFQELIELSQSIDLSVHMGLLNETASSIFVIPATLYYFNIRRNLTVNGTIINSVTSLQYWIAAYELLFDYLDSLFGDLHDKLMANNKRLQFIEAMLNFRTRNELAKKTIRSSCSSERKGDLIDQIKKYKNSPDSYRCESNGDVLPDLNENFDSQNEQIADKRFWVDKELIGNAFDEHLIEEMNEDNSIIYKADVSRIYFFFDEPVYQKPSVDVHIFKYKSYRFALIYEDIDNVTFTLITPQSEIKFCERIGVYAHTRFNDFEDVVYKKKDEKFDDFANNVAKLRSKIFEKQLHQIGYQATTREQVMTFLLNLIPFYNCVNAISEKETTEAITACGLDALFFIPVYGTVVNIGTKIITRAALSSIGTTVRTIAFRESMFISLRMLARNVVKNLAIETTRAFTKESFKIIGISMLRALDPGFEFITKLTRYGIESTLKLFSLIGKSSLHAKISAPLAKRSNLLESIKIGKSYGHDLRVNSLSGTDGMGHKYIHTSIGDLELRKVSGYSSEVPVKLIDVVDGRGIYRAVNMETKQLTGPELESTVDILKQAKKRFDVDDISRICPSLMGKTSVANIRSRRDQNNTKQSKVKRNVESKLLKLDVMSHCLSLTAVGMPSLVPVLEIDEPRLFRELWYKELIGTDVDIKSAERIVQELYGKYLKKLELDIHFIADQFDIFGLRANLMFEDFYAIQNYCRTGYRRIRHGTDEARRMQNAFYRSAVRQASMSQESELLLFRGELRDAMEMREFTVGHSFELDRFTSTSRYSRVAHFFIDIPDNMKHPRWVRILYKIELDSSFLGVDIFEINKHAEEEFLLLPGIKFIVEDVENINRGEIVWKEITIRNVPVEKTERLHDYMRKIKELKESSTRYYATRETSFTSCLG